MSDTQTTNQQEHLVSDWQYPIHKGQVIINVLNRLIISKQKELLKFANDWNQKIENPFDIVDFCADHEEATQLLQSIMSTKKELNACRLFASELGIDKNFVWSGKL